MQYYMLDKQDISKVRGIVSAKDVINELGITNAQFSKMVRNEEIYNGCILVPIIQDSGRELPTSESEELYQLIGEGDNGFRYYITSHLKVVSVSPIDGTEREMRIRKTSETRYVVKIRDGNRNKYISVLGEAYKAFVGGIKDKHIVVCDGDLKIENLNPIKLNNNSTKNELNKNNINVYTHKHKYGEYQHVLLTDKEHTHLVELYGSSLDEHIKILDEYIETSGKKYKNHSLVIQKWVHERYLKDHKNNEHVQLDSKFYAQESNQTQEEINKEMERVRREILGNVA